MLLFVTQQTPTRPRRRGRTATKGAIFTVFVQAAVITVRVDAVLSTFMHFIALSISLTSPADAPESHQRLFVTNHKHSSRAERFCSGESSQTDAGINQRLSVVCRNVKVFIVRCNHAVVFTVELFTVESHGARRRFLRGPCGTCRHV